MSFNFFSPSQGSSNYTSQSNHNGLSQYPANGGAAGGAGVAGEGSLGLGGHRPQSAHQQQQPQPQSQSHGHSHHASIDFGTQPAHHSPPQPMRQLPISVGPSEDDTPKRKPGSGRPRDAIWGYYTDDSDRKVAKCKYCSWQTEHPKAFRMRSHSQVCPGLSDNQKAHIAELVVEAARNAEKAAEKAAQKRAAGGSGSVPPQSGAGQANGGLPGIASLSNDDDWQVTLDPNLNDSADGADLDVLVNPGQGPAKRPRTDGPADERDRQVKIEHQFQQAQSKQIRQQQQKHQQRPSAPAPAPVALPVLAPAPAVGPISHSPTVPGLHSNHAALAASQQAPPAMAKRSPITCHVLDSTSGKPAPDMQVRLDKLGASGFALLSQSVTDGDGRCGQLLTPGSTITAGIYKITFFTSEYFSKRGITSFYPFVEVPFEVKVTDEHYHIPLLLSPFAFSTYRGS